MIDLKSSLEFVKSILKDIIKAIIKFFIFTSVKFQVNEKIISGIEEKSLIKMIFNELK
jgi:hypothetical protein